MGWLLLLAAVRGLPLAERAGHQEATLSADAMLPGEVSLLESSATVGARGFEDEELADLEEPSALPDLRPTHRDLKAGAEAAPWLAKGNPSLSHQPLARVAPASALFEARNADAPDPSEAKAQMEEREENAEKAVEAAKVNATVHPIHPNAVHHFNEPIAPGPLGPPGAGDRANESHLATSDERMQELFGPPKGKGLRTKVILAVAAAFTTLMITCYCIESGGKPIKKLMAKADDEGDDKGDDKGDQPTCLESCVKILPCGRGGDTQGRASVDAQGFSCG